MKGTTRALSPSSRARSRRRRRLVLGHAVSPRADLAVWLRFFLVFSAAGFGDDGCRCVCCEMGICGFFFWFVEYEYAGEVSRSVASGAPAGVVYSSADLEAEKLELEVA